MPQTCRTSVQRADASAQIDDPAAFHFDREVASERLGREERAGDAVDMVGALLPVFEDKQAFIERQNVCLEVGARLRMQGPCCLVSLAIGLLRKGKAPPLEAGPGAMRFVRAATARTAARPDSDRA
jgi:hypothetical protein